MAIRTESVKLKVAFFRLCLVELVCLSRLCGREEGPVLLLPSLASAPKQASNKPAASSQQPASSSQQPAARTQRPEPSAQHPAPSTQRPLPSAQYASTLKILPFPHPVSSQLVDQRTPSFCAHRTDQSLFQ